MTDGAQSTRIHDLVPALRRYARAALGDVERADACVATALERVVAPAGGHPSAVALYREVYLAARRTPMGPAGAEPGEGFAGRLRRLAPEARHALLLRRLEGLVPAAAAAVMATDAATVEELVHAALAALRTRDRRAVLIIEDDAALAERFAAVVARLGHAVMGRADSVDAALAAARGRRFDLVLADADLRGGRDGVDAAEAVRADRDVPAIVLAAAPERIPRTRLHRPDRVVRKPCDDDALAAALDRALPADPTAPVA